MTLIPEGYGSYGSVFAMFFAFERLDLRKQSREVCQLLTLLLFCEVSRSLRRDESDTGQCKGALACPRQDGAVSIRAGSFSHSISLLLRLVICAFAVSLVGECVLHVERTCERVGMSPSRTCQFTPEHGPLGIGKSLIRNAERNCDTCETKAEYAQNQ